MSGFEELAGRPDPPLDRLALALAAEFRPVDEAAALDTLDALGEELAETGVPIGELLGARHGFTGERTRYDDPDNSMLDLVLERRVGLPISLSVVYVEVARRAGLALAGVGLPGHYVVGDFSSDPPRLLDPFAGGGPLRQPFDARFVRPWGAKETALRMLNNLVGAYDRRGNVAHAIRAAELRLALAAGEPYETELRSLRARLN